MFNFCRPGHFFVHLGLEECAPELLSQEVLIHFKLIRVFIVIGCLISDLLLSSIALNSSFKCSLFVVKRLEHGCKTILPLEVILINEAHQLLEPVLRLQPLLLCLTVSLRFFHKDRLLVLVAILRLIKPNLNGDQVGIHALDHVLSLTFDHFGLIVLIFDFFKSVRGLVQSGCLAINAILDRRFVNLRLLQLSL